MVYGGGEVGIARIRHEDFIARVDQASDGHGHAISGAGRDENTLDIRLDMITDGEFCGNGVSKNPHAGIFRIPERTFVRCLDDGLPDEVVRRFLRLSESQLDRIVHVPASHDLVRQPANAGARQSPQHIVYRVPGNRRHG